MENCLAVSETFYSIQGEGIYLGEPSFFIRTNYCNLRCPRCDTPYTSLAPEEASSVGVNQLVNEALRYPARHVVITGGEPTLWKRALPVLCSRLKQYHKLITLETNGLLFLPELIGKVHLFSVSPKLSSMTPEAGKFRSIHERGVHKAKETINKYIYYIPAGQHLVQVKFVVDQPEDVCEVEEFLQDIKGLDLLGVYIVLMPQGRTAGEYHEKASWLVEVCKEKGWRYTPRVHLDIWGPVRGV